MSLSRVPSELRTLKHGFTISYSAPCRRAQRHNVVGHVVRLWLYAIQIKKYIYKYLDALVLVFQNDCQLIRELQIFELVEHPENVRELEIKHA